LIELLKLDEGALAFLGQGESESLENFIKNLKVILKKKCSTGLVATGQL
jgi:hypothetical protein